MNITFLGTGGAHGYPEPFCRCDNCERARELGGPSLRKRASALINDDLVIDLGPDVLAASFMHGSFLSRVRYCLQTHAHEDHIYPSYFLSRRPEFGHTNAPRLHFYASKASVQRVAQALEKALAPASLLDTEVCERLNLEIHQIEALQSFTVGRYHVTAFPANHDATVEPLLYAVEGDGRTLFYGTDTSTLPEETWQAFHRHKLQFDVVILDHTHGDCEPARDPAGNPWHMNAQEFVDQVERMRQEGLLTEKAVAYATHIAHAGNPVHPEMVEIAARHGYKVAFDGLSV